MEDIPFIMFYVSYKVIIYTGEFKKLDKTAHCSECNAKVGQF